MINFEEVISVKAGKGGFTNMDTFDNDSLEFIKFNVLQRSYGNIPNVLIKLKCVDCREEIEAEIIENEPRRTLMDLARESQELRYYPKLNHVEKQGLYESFLSTLHPSEDILNALFLRGPVHHFIL